MDGDLIVVGKSIKNKVSDVSGESLNKIVKRSQVENYRRVHKTTTLNTCKNKGQKKEGSFSLFFLPSRQLVRERSLHGA